MPLKSKIEEEAHLSDGEDSFEEVDVDEERKLQEVHGFKHLNQSASIGTIAVS